MKPHLPARTPRAEPSASPWRERLLAWAERCLPHHALAGCAQAVARCRWRPFKDALIGWFVRHYDIDLEGAAEPDPRRYEHFNAFFTRALKEGARSWPAADSTVASPVDAQVSQIGYAQGGLLVQAKGRHYSVAALLGGDAELAACFRDGAYATLYLSPRDYHRVHMPLAGRLRRMVYVPGRLFSVKERTTRMVDALFARNERVISEFDTVAGPMALIMVGALFVGGLETVWAGPVTPPRRRSIQVFDYREGDQAVALERGAEMGRFNMGSTVILLFGRDRVRWSPALAAGSSVCLGAALGEVR